MPRRTLVARLLAGLFAFAAQNGAAAPRKQGLPGQQPRMIEPDDPRYDLFAKARHAYWSQFGAVDKDVITYLVSPQFQGAPGWPTTRQAFCIVRTSEGVIIASDGLSDLFVDTDMQDAGFGCEVFIETDMPRDAKFGEIKSSWQFSLIENFARNVADLGGIENQIQVHGLISMELPAPPNSPNDWQTKEGMIGVLVNMVTAERNPSCKLDDQHSIRMIPITILRPNELAKIAAGKPGLRESLAAKLIASGSGLRSVSNRKSVIAN